MHPLEKLYEKTNIQVAIGSSPIVPKSLPQQGARTYQSSVEAVWINYQA